MSSASDLAIYHRFAGRTVGVATLHDKARVIGPALKRVLPIADCLPIAGVDTDRWGAFSGEVQRIGDPLSTCVQKAKHGAEVSGMDLVIASEGSFGPYPFAPFISCDEEILVLFDACDGTVFEHRHVSLDTVFGAERCTSVAEVNAFAERMKFPGHQLVLRSKERWQEGDDLYKGINDRDRLRRIAETILAQHGCCWAETDMRAMANPTRMKVISDTAEGFAQQLATLCPECGECWFRITQALPGLPCGMCGWPTRSTRAYRRTCRTCGVQEDKSRPDGKTTEEPLHCDNCNP